MVAGAPAPCISAPLPPAGYPRTASPRRIFAVSVYSVHSRGVPRACPFSIVLFPPGRAPRHSSAVLVSFLPLFPAGTNSCRAASPPVESLGEERGGAWGRGEEPFLQKGVPSPTVIFFFLLSLSLSLSLSRGRRPRGAFSPYWSTVFIPAECPALARFPLTYSRRAGPPAFFSHSRQLLAPFPRRNELLSRGLPTSRKS